MMECTDHIFVLVECGGDGSARPCFLSAFRAPAFTGSVQGYFDQMEYQQIKYCVECQSKGNVTTLIAALVLGIFGTGTIKGFAITLAIGVVLSVFTALAVSQSLAPQYGFVNTVGRLQMAKYLRRWKRGDQTK